MNSCVEMGLSKYLSLARVCIVGLILWGLCDCRIVKRPVFSPQFQFLVQGEEFLVRTKTSIENIQYNLTITLDEENWDVYAETLTKLFGDFEKLNFFSADAEFKNEILKQTTIGFEAQRSSYSHINDILKFKGTETLPVGGLAKCSRSIFELNDKEIKRGIENLNWRFARIDTNWPVAELKTDPQKLNIISSFISSYNLFFVNLDKMSSEALFALESLSDGHFPESLMFNNKSCEGSNIVLQTEGEIYHILKCIGTVEGYFCLTTVTQAMQLSSLTRLHPVNYGGLQISGISENWEFVRHPDTEITELAHCKDERTPHPECITASIPEKCKAALAANHAHQVIHNCNFTYVEIPPPYFQVAEGGILVQSAKAVSSGDKAISERLPVLIYSPSPVSVTQENGISVIVPDKRIETFSVVGSSLTDEDLDELYNTHLVVNWIDTLGDEDFFNLALGAVQLPLLAITIWGMMCAIRQRKIIRELSNLVRGPSKKQIYKKNYEKVRVK